MNVTHVFSLFYTNFVTIQQGEILLHYDMIAVKSHAEPQRLLSRKGGDFEPQRSSSGVRPWEKADGIASPRKAFRPLKKTQILKIIRWFSAALRDEKMVNHIYLSTLSYYECRLTGTVGRPLPCAGNGSEYVES